MELSIASEVAWWHKNIPGNQNDTLPHIGNKVILILLRTFARPVGYELVQLDIETAYIHGNLKETV